MKSVPLTVFPRTLAKRPGVKKLRASGRVPAVIYGRRCQPQNLEIKTKDLEDLVHGTASENILVDLTLTSGTPPTCLALVQQIQHHPLSGRALHVDFHEVSPDEKVAISVPVETVGEALGVKRDGGVLEHVLFKLRVRALPKDLPETILVDVSHLEIGMAIHIGEIPPPPGVEILGGKSISVIAVSAPITEAEEAAAEAAAEGALGEPEVLTEKKEEGAEEAGKAPEKGGAKGAEAGAAKAGEKAAAKPGEAAAAKPGEKAAEKKAEKKK